MKLQVASDIVLEIFESLGLDVEGCFLFVTHKLRRMRTNLFSGAVVLPHA